MPVADDTADWIAGEINELGLEFEGTEISGNGYARLEPTYGAATSGVADLDATLEFDGPENADVDAVRFYRPTDDLWFTRDLTAAAQFNSDGRLDLTSAPIEVAVNGS